MVRVVFSYGPTSPRLWSELTRSELSEVRVVWLPYEAYLVLKISNVQTNPSYMTFQGNIEIGYIRQMVA